MFTEGIPHIAGEPSYQYVVEHHNGCHTPPPPMSGFHFFFVAVPFSIIFVVGLMGNTAVLTYILFLTRSLRGSVFNLGNTIIYILALSLVDLMVILSIPFHLTGILMGNWLFGLLTCKAYWLLEMSNKLCSAFILTAMAFDRFMAVCYSKITWIHSIKSTVTMICGSLVLSVLMITPVLYLSKVAQVSKKEAYISYPLVGNTTVCIIDRNMCFDGMTRTIRYWFSVFIFLFAFLLPALSLCFCYIKMSMSLRKKARSLMQSHIPIGRVTRYAFIVIMCYLLSQAPYWLTQIYTTFLEFSNKNYGNILYITYICHMCPFLAAALNWILYARLNTQLRKGLTMANEHYNRDIKRKYCDAPMTEMIQDDNTTLLLANVPGKVCSTCGQHLSSRSLKGAHNAFSAKVPTPREEP